MPVVAAPLLAPLGGAAAAGVSIGATKLIQDWNNFRRDPSGGIVGGAIDTGEATLAEKVADYLAGAQVPAGFPEPPFLNPGPLLPISPELLERGLSQSWSAANNIAGEMVLKLPQIAGSLLEAPIELIGKLKTDVWNYFGGAITESGNDASPEGVELVEVSGTRGSDGGWLDIIWTVTGIRRKIENGSIVCYNKFTQTSNSLGTIRYFNGGGDVKIVTTPGSGCGAASISVRVKNSAVSDSYSSRTISSAPYFPVGDITGAQITLRYRDPEGTPVLPSPLTPPTEPLTEVKPKLSADDATSLPPNTVTAGAKAAGDLVLQAAGGLLVPGPSGSNGGNFQGGSAATARDVVTIGQGSVTGDILTVNSANGETLRAGDELRGNGLAAGTQITGRLTGTGADGTYTVTPAQESGLGAFRVVGTGPAAGASPGTETASGQGGALGGTAIGAATAGSGGTAGGISGNAVATAPTAPTGTGEALVPGGVTATGTGPALPPEDAGVPSVIPLPQLPAYTPAEPANRTGTGLQTGTVAEPAAAPTPATPTGAVKVGDQTYNGGTASINPLQVAQEILKVEKKLENMLRPPSLSSPDWMQALEAIANLLSVFGSANTWTLTEYCPPPGEEPNTLEWQVPGVPLVNIGLAQRLDALAEMIQEHKNMDQPICKNRPMGQPVQVQFIQSELSWEPLP